MMTQMRKRETQRRNAAGCCADIGELMQPSFFKALSDPNRIAILARLATSCSACTVSEIADCCPVNVSVVSRHLAMLRDAGILAARKEGKQVYYSVRYAALADSLRQIADGIEACCPVESRVAKKLGE
jgi:ArsR family transcriptional regulator